MREKTSSTVRGSDNFVRRQIRLQQEQLMKSDEGLLLCLPCEDDDTCIEKRIQHHLHQGHYSYKLKAVAYDDLLRHYLRNAKTTDETLTIYLASTTGRSVQILCALVERYGLKQKTMHPGDDKMRYILCPPLNGCVVPCCPAYVKCVTKIPIVISNPNHVKVNLMVTKKSVREMLGMKLHKGQEFESQRRTASASASPSPVVPCQDALPALPSECLVGIFSFLTCQDAMNGNRVSKHWYKTLNTNADLWKRWFLNESSSPTARARALHQAANDKKNVDDSAKFWKLQCLQSLGFCQSRQRPCFGAPKHRHTR